MDLSPCRPQSKGLVFGLLVSLVIETRHFVVVSPIREVILRVRYLWLTEGLYEKNSKHYVWFVVLTHVIKFFFSL